MEKGQRWPPTPWPSVPRLPLAYIAVRFIKFSRHESRAASCDVGVSAGACVLSTEGGDQGASPGSESRREWARVCGRQWAGLIDQLLEQPRAHSSGSHLSQSGRENRGRRPGRCRRGHPGSSPRAGAITPPCHPRGSGIGGGGPRLRDPPSFRDPPALEPWSFVSPSSATPLGPGCIRRHRVSTVERAPLPCRPALHCRPEPGEGFQKGLSKMASAVFQGLCSLTWA